MKYYSGYSEFIGEGKLLGSISSSEMNFFLFCVFEYFFEEYGLDIIYHPEADKYGVDIEDNFLLFTEGRYNINYIYDIDERKFTYIYKFGAINSDGELLSGFKGVGEIEKFVEYLEYKVSEMSGNDITSNYDRSNLVSLLKLREVKKFLKMLKDMFSGKSKNDSISYLLGKIGMLKYSIDIYYKLEKFINGRDVKYFINECLNNSEKLMNFIIDNRGISYERDIDKIILTKLT